MAAEYLTFNKGGQWELRKATAPNSADEHPPADDYTSHNKPYKSFRTNQGELHEDHGQKGTLHDFNGGKTPKHRDQRKATTPHHNVQSFYNERNPGVGD